MSTSTPAYDPRSFKALTFHDATPRFRDVQWVAREPANADFAQY